MFNLDAFRRKYCCGDTEVVTFRLPTKLKKRLQKYAENNGRSTTDLVTTALDQFVQAVEAEDSSNGKRRKAK